MTTDTFTGGTGDGFISGTSTTYATARSTSTGSEDVGATGQAGQLLDGSMNFIFRGFLVFDTSAIPDDVTVTAATIKITAEGDSSVTDFDLRVYRYAWADTLASNREANYDGAYGGSATLEGTLRDTADGWVSGTQYSLAVDSAGINLTGDTRYSLVSSRDATGTEPIGSEYINWRAADHTTDADRPKLEVTYTEAGDGPSNSLMLMGIGG